MLELISFWNRLKSGMKSMPIKHKNMWSLRWGTHMWLNIRDFQMFDGLVLHFIAKYVGPYEFCISRILMCTL
jgi:hypothetical protein